jgi:hypothetical protein
MVGNLVISTNDIVLYTLHCPLWIAGSRIGGVSAFFTDHLILDVGVQCIFGRWNVL